MSQDPMSQNTQPQKAEPQNTVPQDAARHDAVRATVLRVLADIASDADLAALRGDDELRLALDLDSMDFLELVSRLGAELRCDIPESAYSQLATLDACVAWLAARPASTPQPGGQP